MLKKQNLYIGFFFVILLFIAALRPVGFDPDSKSYFELFKEINSTYITDLKIESTYKFFSYLYSYHFQFIIITYATLALFVKFYFIRNFSDFPVISIIVYIGLYFSLHEMTQIRVGLAAAFFLIALPDIANRRFTSYFIKILIATTFHYSAIFLFPLYLLSTKNWSRIKSFSLLFFSILTSLLMLNFTVFLERISYLLPSVIYVKFIHHINNFDNNGIGLTINKFDAFHITLIIIAFIAIFMIKEFKKPLETICFKIFIIGLSSFYILSFLPVLAMRVSELYCVVAIILIPSFINYFKNKKIVSFFIILYSIMVLCTYVFLKDNYFNYHLEWFNYER